MIKRFIFAATAAILGLTSLSIGSAEAQQPWEEPNDPAMAINAPDEYAWRLFVALNWPAGPGTCRSDSTKRLGDPGITTWESWRSREETYLRDAVRPPDWDSSCVTVVAKQLTPAGQVAALEPDILPAFVDPQGPLSTQASEEVRLNKGAYGFVLGEKLYSRNEQTERARIASKARTDGTPLPDRAVIKFPTAAKEVKGHWIIIRDEDKPRYHWTNGRFQGKDVVYGLVALSITTKDLPNWFWATFEHVDNEHDWPELKKKWPDEFASDPNMVARLNAIVQNWFAGWVVKPVDRFACKMPPHDCKEIPRGLGLENTKWQYYRLRGTQTDFVDSAGNPTRLVNSKIEGIFQQHSMSCITCHALAAVDSNSSRMPVFILEKNGKTREDRIGYIGVPRLSINDMMQLDFVWSLRKADCDPNDSRPCRRR
jgi:hypothetical protein